MPYELALHGIEQLRLHRERREQGYTHGDPAGEAGLVLRAVDITGESREAKAGLGLDLDRALGMRRSSEQHKSEPGDHSLDVA
jgi:hypothetical protein